MCCRTSPVNQRSFPRWVLVGDGSLLAACGDVLLSLGHEIACVFTGTAGIERWARERGVEARRSHADLAIELPAQSFDHLACIVHLALVPSQALACVPGVALNFHDGPLPRYAGLNATSWAILKGERTHGVTWHVMTEQPDQGRILEQRVFALAADETALSLNERCFAAGLESFGVLARRLAAGDASGREQDPAERSYFRRNARPTAAAVIDWRAPALAIHALVRALDFGPHRNPLCLPKLLLGEELIGVTQLETTRDSSGLAPGTVVAMTARGMRIATGTTDVEVSRLCRLDGGPRALQDVVRGHGLVTGARLPLLSDALRARLDDAARSAAAGEHHWSRALASPIFPDLDLPHPDPAASPTAGGDVPRADDLRTIGGVDAVVAAIAVYLARRSGESEFDIAWGDAAIAEGARATVGALVPFAALRVRLDRGAPFVSAVAAIASALASMRERGPIAADLWGRDPELAKANPGGCLAKATVGIGLDVEPPSARLRLAVSSAGAACRVVGGTCAADIAAQLDAVIATALGTPGHTAIGQFPLVSPDERDRLLAAGRGPTLDVPDALLPQLFSDRARSRPGATALILREQATSFGDLDRSTNRLARRLRVLGVKPGRRVGVLLNRSLAMVEAVLAILKAGAAYVPLDATHPAARLRFMAEDARLALVLSERALAAIAPRQAPVLWLDGEDERFDAFSPEPLAQDAGPGDLAYLIYTSGSTGEPKGVMVEHRNLSSFVVAMDEHIDSTHGTTFLALTSLSFDISVVELLYALARGYTIVLHRDSLREAFVAARPQAPLDGEASRHTLRSPHQGRSAGLTPVPRGPCEGTARDPRDERRRSLQDLEDPGEAELRAAGRGSGRSPPADETAGAAAIAALIERHRVTHLQCTPTLARLLVQNDESRRALGRLHQLLVGGEALPEQLARSLSAAVRGSVANVYGPTETTVWSTIARLGDEASPVTIGFPLANTTLYVQDHDRQLAPIGLAGELLIGGAGVARGYWERPELTAKRFVPNPFGPGQVYRTGDRVRRQRDGSLVFLGRIDRQVKIRGHRVEPGEIEARLNEHPGVVQAAVVVLGNGEDRELVANVVTSDPPPTEAQLRAHLRSFLPEALLPRRIHSRPMLPFMPSGKVDYAALESASAGAGTYAELRTSHGSRGPLEEAIASIWCDVLQRDSVDIDSHFTDLGGDSLALVRVLGRLQQRFGEGATLVDLFRHPTIRATARFLEDAAGGRHAGAASNSGNAPWPSA